MKQHHKTQSDRALKCTQWNLIFKWNNRPEGASVHCTESTVRKPNPSPCSSIYIPAFSLTDVARCIRVYLTLFITYKADISKFAKRKSFCKTLHNVYVETVQAYTCRRCEPFGIIPTCDVCLQLFIPGVKPSAIMAYLNQTEGGSWYHMTPSQPIRTN